MEIIKIEKSFEMCNQAGWIGYDIYFSENIDEDFIKSLSLFGHLLFLSNLKNPFFKVENNNLIIKGTLNQNKIRIGCLDKDNEIFNMILSNLPL
ncbi:MAG: hypothetical protein ACPKM0_03095 [Pleomorphochaeta sp.]